MKLNRELSQQSWLEVKHSVLDDSFGCENSYMVLSFFNFHERSELTSTFTSILTSEALNSKKTCRECCFFEQKVVPLQGLSTFTMKAEVFNYLIYGMTAMAFVVFVSLYFVTAGYGQFRTKQWGWSINNRVAWMLMEVPVFLVMLAIWWSSPLKWHLPQLVLFCLFELHYFQRSLVFPWLLKGKSRMPVAIMTMGIVFNLINGFLQGGGLYLFPNPDFGEGAAYLLRWNAILGILVFIIGMAINLHSDHVIRHLRKPGDTKHYLPQKGMYRFVTSANYLGEILEWTGFALAAATSAAWVFPIWTAANLVPRAHSIYNRYKDEFGQEALKGRKRIIPFVY